MTRCLAWAGIRDKINHQYTFISTQTHTHTHTLHACMHAYISVQNISKPRKPRHPFPTRCRSLELPFAEGPLLAAAVALAAQEVGWTWSSHRLVQQQQQHEWLLQQGPLHSQLDCSGAAGRTQQQQQQQEAAHCLAVLLARPAEAEGGPWVKAAHRRHALAGGCSVGRPSPAQMQGRAMALLTAAKAHSEAR